LMQLTIRHTIVALALVCAGACTDAPTTSNAAPVPSTGPLASAASGAQRLGQGLTPFPCTFRIKDEEGLFRTRRAQVDFPVSDLHPGGVRTAYLYRAYSGREVVLIAACVIPATDPAIDRIHRAFKTRRVVSGATGITPMGCVQTEQGCTLDPVEVDACVGGGTYPDCDAGSDEDYDTCYDLGDCGGSGDWDWSGGGSSPNTSPTDLQRDTIPPADCQDPDNSQWEKVYCRALPPDANQMQKTLQALDEISRRGEECVLVAQRGRELLAAGQIRFFDWREGEAGGYGHRNTGIQLDSNYPTLYGTEGSGFERVLVHEIDHVLGYGHTDSAGLDTPHTAQCG
jgi:hypothetical protein